jgi:hypothetical protein
MKIAIIGGGWVGCHLSYKLKDTHDITLFEKNNLLFDETSYNNQNRLHLGYHYARNHKTRMMCKDTFTQFMDDYGFMTEEVKKNLYCIPFHKSTIDYGTYEEIFNVHNKKITDDVTFNNIEGCINTDERYINFKIAHEFFNKELSGLVVNETVTPLELKKISKEFDLVINATNNHIKDLHNQNSFFELTISLIYKKITETKFDALTIVDGDFFSIYPYQKDKFTLTDVEHTPLKKFKTIKKLNEYKETITNDLIDNKIKLIEKKVKKYFPEFLTFFKYDSYFLSTKSKILSKSDERYPVITKSGNVINCFTGKIQGIYIIENTLKQDYYL